MEIHTETDNVEFDGEMSNESASDKENVVRLTRREEILMIKEEKLRKEQNNLTFKPAIVRRGRDETVTKNVNSFDRLYNQAKEKKKTVKPEFSFKPEITDLAKSKQRSSTPDDKTSRLYNSNGAGRPRSAVPNDKQEKEKCTFKPEISKRAQSLERRRDASPATRLREMGEISKKKIEKLKEVITSKESENCTFTPRTNSARRNSTEPEKLAVSERMQRYVEQRNKKLETKKQQIIEAEAESTTFQPISYTKYRPTRSDRDAAKVDVFSRLSTVPTATSPVTEIASDKEYTFHPTLVAKSAATTNAGEYENVHERLYVEGEKRKKDQLNHIEELRKEMDKSNTFSPHLMHKSNHSGNAENIQAPVFERLSASRQYVHEILTQIKSEFEMEQCTFHPQINENSEHIAKSSGSSNKPIYVRLNSEAEVLKSEHDRIKKQYEDEEKAKCTYSPVLGSSFSKKKNANFTKHDSNVFDRLATTQHHPESAVKATPSPAVKVVPRTPKTPSGNAGVSNPNTEK